MITSEREKQEKEGNEGKRRSGARNDASFTYGNRWSTVKRADTPKKKFPSLALCECVFLLNPVSKREKREL